MGTPLPENANCIGVIHMTDAFSELEEFFAASPEPTVDDRVANDADRHADRIYHDMLLAWAAVDDGPVPSREQARERALDEVEVLVRALGEWAELPAHRLWPTADLARRTSRRARRRYLSPDDFDLFGDES